MDRQDLQLKTRDGVAPARLFQSEPVAARAGIIFYMDAFGPRPALDRMAERLAGEGYSVLVPDLFYRFGEYTFDAKTAFGNEATRAQLMRMIGATTHEMTRIDTGAFVDALSEHGATGPIGTVGYCFGGGRALNAAAAYPDRIRAAASFHGGGLAADTPDSPRANAASVKARVYVGSAGVDGSFPPEQSAALAKAFRAAEVDHVIENYVGMEHGWAVPDSRVFNEAGAERHWKRLTTFFSENLGGA